MIKGVDMVILPVDDQERAREFWHERVGFEVTTDEPYDGGRWLELTPPDRSVILVLSRRSPDEPGPGASDTRPSSPVFFTCEDIHETYRELCDRGVKFITSPTEMPFGWWSMFENNEGTRYALHQR
jgi:predicted enzyme related to lactoylglutathione lyase